MFILFVCFCYLFHCMIFYIRIHHIDIYQVVYRTILVLIICIITDTAHFGYCLKDELDFRFASPVFSSSIKKRKLTVNSLSTNINKTNNYLSHQIMNIKNTMTYHSVGQLYLLDLIESYYPYRSSVFFGLVVPFILRRILTSHL